MSVLRQTYNQIEVIIVDDCSPDGSIDVAQKLIDKHQDPFEIRIITHEKNLGVAGARNTGIKNAKGFFFFS